jgi:hypothetical protein
MIELPPVGRLWLPERPAIIRSAGAKLSEPERPQLMRGGLMPMVVPFIKPAIGTPVSLGVAQGTGGSTSATMTTTAAIPAGALVVIGIMTGFAGSQTITSVSDGTNTYTRAAGGVWDATGAFVCDLWYKENASPVSSGATITANYSGTSVSGTNVPIFCAAYVTGVIGASSLDKTSSGKQLPGTAYASGSSGTLSQANEIVFGFVVLTRTPPQSQRAAALPRSTSASRAPAITGPEILRTRKFQQPLL